MELRAQQEANYMIDIQTVEDAHQPFELTVVAFVRSGFNIADDQSKRRMSIFLEREPPEQNNRTCSSAADYFFK